MNKILLVDDNADNVRLLSLQLQQHGYEIMIAFSGQQALEMIERQNPDLVLLDIMMPGTDGLEVCRKLKANPHTNAIPILLVTARILNSDQIQGLDAGADDYITKPFDFRILLARIKAALRTKQAYDLIQEMNHKLNEARGLAERANRAKSNFLANMSHEIRTPMTAILGFAEILRGNLQQEGNPDALETIHRNVEYLLDILNDILDLSKIEAGQLLLEQELISPPRLVEEIVFLMRDRAENRGLHLNIKYEGPVPNKILTDNLRIRQVLVNLVSNAIKFTERGSVTILVHAMHGQVHPGWIEFQVIDTGIGIPKDKTVDLFQPFSQADRSIARRFGGTGLGLAICKELVTLLGGEIFVESEPDKGSRFFVRIPVGNVPDLHYIDPEADDSWRDPDDKSVKDLAKFSDKTRILVAEDGPDNQRLITFFLESAGAEVTPVSDGQTAEELILTARDKGIPYDLVILDMQMPIQDGYETVCNLRAEGYGGTIVALTASARKEDKRRCISAGCDDFVSKPFRHAEFLGRMVKLVKKSQKHSENIG